MRRQREYQTQVKLGAQRSQIQLCHYIASPSVTQLVSFSCFLPSIDLVITEMYNQLMIFFKLSLGNFCRGRGNVWWWSCIRLSTSPCVTISKRSHIRRAELKTHKRFPASEAQSNQSVALLILIRMQEVICAGCPQPLQEDSSILFFLFFFTLNGEQRTSLKSFHGGKWCFAFCFLWLAHTAFAMHLMSRFFINRKPATVALWHLKAVLFIFFPRIFKCAASFNHLHFFFKLASHYHRFPTGSFPERCRNVSMWVCVCGAEGVGDSYEMNPREKFHWTFQAWPSPVLCHQRQFRCLYSGHILCAAPSHATALID